ncbi:MAG: carotenoid oxygenase family protein, partial [Myxococcota bacterium]
MPAHAPGAPRVMIAQAAPHPRTMAEVYRRSTRPVERECECALECISGTLPDALQGVLFRNGPGRQEIFGVPYGHPFDGDGMLTRFEFRDGQVHYRNRYVQTRELREETRAGRSLYRSFGTNLPGGLSRNALRLRFKNAANTSVVLHGGKLLALWEGGWPHALDPKTLDTQSRYNFGGNLRNRRIDRFLSPELPFSAHPKRCPLNGELVNFGMALGVKPRLMLYRISAAGEMDSPVSLELPELSFVHDFVLTERHLVFFLPAVAFDVPKALAGLSTPVDSLRALERPTKILVLDRKSFRRVFELETEPGFVFHFANGYEEPDGGFVVDGYRMPELPNGDAIRDVVEGRASEYPRATLIRTRFRPGESEVQSEELYPLPGELPHIDPRYLTQRHRVIFAALSPLARPDPFLTALGRFDLEARTSTVRDFGQDLVGEPVFVPRSATAPEGDGFLLVLCHAADRDRGLR